VSSLRGSVQSFPSESLCLFSLNPRAVLKCEVKDKHPWKNSGVKSNFTYEESDRELLAAIYNPKGW